MPEAVSGPTYLCLHSELSIQPIVTDSVLVEYVIDVTDCLVVLDPSAVGDLELAFLDEFLYLFLLVVVEGVVPILEEDDLGHEILSDCAAGKCLFHGVEDGLGIALIHSVEEAGGTEVNVFEIVVGVQPEGIEMRVEGDEELLSLGRTTGGDRAYEEEQGQQANDLFK